MYTDEHKLQEFQKPGNHVCEIKIFIFVKSRSGAHLTLAGALTEPSDIKSKMIFDEFGNIFTHLD